MQLCLTPTHDRSSTPFELFPRELAIEISKERIDIDIQGSEKHLNKVLGIHMNP
jgi:hypothetical protein